jgi:hypothetical protein
MYIYILTKKDVIMKSLKRYILVILSAILVFSLVGCDEKKVLESSREELTVVKTVADLDVPLEMYRYVALNLKSSYEYGSSADIWLGDAGQALLDEMNKDINSTLVQIYTVPAICKEYGININDQYVLDMLEIKMDDIYESYGYDYKAYDADISEYNMNDSVYRFFIRNEILADEIIAKMMERGEAPGDVETIKAILNGEECVRVKQILIASDNGKTEEENTALAEKILSMIEDGANFEELVREYGEDLFMFNNTDGYYVTRGNFHEEFEDTAFSLEIGEVSGIIKTDAGLSIIKRYEKDAAYIEKNADSLASDYIEGLYNIALDKYSSTLVIEDTPKASKYSIFNLK